LKSLLHIFNKSGITFTSEQVSNPLKTVIVKNFPKSFYRTVHAAFMAALDGTFANVMTAEEYLRISYLKMPE